MSLTAITQPVRTAGRPFRAGARAIAPLVVGTAPFGLAIGAAGAGLGTGRFSTWIASWSMIAGTAQLTVMQLLHEGASPLVAIAAALVVNARFAVYSAGLAPWFDTTSVRQRLLLAAPLVDQLFITATTAFQAAPMAERDRRAFYLGAATHFVVAWVAAESIGVFAGGRLPGWLGLHAVALLALVGLLATATSGHPAAIAVIVAALVAIAGARLPAHSCVVVATIAGIAVGGARRVS